MRRLTQGVVFLLPQPTPDEGFEWLKQLAEAKCAAQLTTLHVRGVGLVPPILRLRADRGSDALPPER